jgi:hypothetical protein
MQLDRDVTAVSAFVVGTLLAGGNAVGVRVSNRELDPHYGVPDCASCSLLAFLERSWPS